MIELLCTMLCVGVKMCIPTIDFIKLIKKFKKFEIWLKFIDHLLSRWDTKKQFIGQNSEFRSELSTFTGLISWKTQKNSLRITWKLFLIKNS